MASLIWSDPKKALSRVRRHAAAGGIAGGRAATRKTLQSFPKGAAMSRLPGPKPDTQTPQTPQQSGLGYLVRFVWMLIGPAIVILSLLLLFRGDRGNFSTADAVLWIAVGACVVLRYVDVSRLNGLKATGERATMADWRRYAVVLVIVASGLWILARSTPILAILRGRS
jgi:hypothetical protein